MYEPGVKKLCYINLTASCNITSDPCNLTSDPCNLTSVFKPFLELRHVTLGTLKLTSGL